MPAATIIFQSEEDLDFPLKEEKKVKDWIKQIIRQEGKTCGQLFYFFCTDEHLLNINKEFLNHDTYTDIITFDYTEGNIVSSEIFISIDRVEENATKFRVPFNNELNRTMIHGILHLCGYGDKTPADKEVMRKKEDEALRLLSSKSTPGKPKR